MIIKGKHLLIIEGFTKKCENLGKILKITLYKKYRIYL